MNLSLTGLITLRSSLAHGGFEAAGLVVPFRREAIAQRNDDGSVMLDDYAFQADDPLQLETLRGYAQRLLRIIWQSKSDATQWTYAQLSGRVAMAAMMENDLGGLVNAVITKMGATSLVFFQDDAEFFSTTLSAMDNVLLLNLLRQPGERLLIIARMQAQSQARYEKRDLPQMSNGQMSLFAEPEQESAAPLKAKRVPYVPRVPVYSGNALRNGVVRRHAARFILKKFGWYPSIDSFRNLFSGGSLQRTGQKGIDIEARRAIINLMPLYGLFGGGFNQNNMIEGSSKPLKAWPIVREAKPAIHPDFWREADDLGMQDVMSVEAYARREDAALLAGEFLKQQPTNGKHPALEDSGNVKNNSMPFEREVMITNTRLYTEWSFWQVAPLQIGAWVSAFVSWAEWSNLGGAANHGHGQANIEYWLGDDVFLAVRHKKLELGAVAADVLKEYEKHLESNRAKLKDFLECSDVAPTESVDIPSLQAAMEAEELD